jgi:hypothetical protein
VSIKAGELHERRRWRQRATAIETFRKRSGFSDPERALPDRPDPDLSAELAVLRGELETHREPTPQGVEPARRDIGRER